MSLVQITRHVEVKKKVPEGQQPNFDLDLGPDSRILHVESVSRTWSPNRVTADWTIVFWTEWRDNSEALAIEPPAVASAAFEPW